MLAGRSTAPTTRGPPSTAQRSEPATATAKRPTCPTPASASASANQTRSNQKKQDLPSKVRRSSHPVETPDAVPASTDCSGRPLHGQALRLRLSDEAAVSGA